MEGTRPGPLTGFALGLALLYGAVRTYWQLGHMPERLSPIGPDLMVFTGWWAVALCGAAALLLAVMLTANLAGRARAAVLTASWAVGAALIVAGALLLLDVVGGILPGLGIPVHPLGAASKAACVGTGALLLRAASTYRRRTGGHALPALAGTPRWAYAAAYTAVAGCAARIAAQAVVGFGETPFGDGGMVLFEGGFLLAGTVLPLALVHRWGRVWPRWVPWLAGGRVPRPLVLWPAAGVSGGLVAYFGTGLGQMVYERLNGRNPFPPEGGLALPEAFFWVSVPAYLVWGAGLAVATVAYALRTRATAHEGQLSVS
ncbi:hypothetical protein [Nonomuraea sp. SBT364]|uniref:hypothetical protein n=1 Tax=Nonomuraea sp. SBT364 TaxID=1580530 RepID=UPI0009E95BC0|nr:hypothetical protein [Nonomuraea sp. SBT364]